MSEQTSPAHSDLSGHKLSKLRGARTDTGDAVRHRTYTDAFRLQIAGDPHFDEAAAE